MGVSTDGILFFGLCWNEEGFPGVSGDDGVWEEPDSLYDLEEEYLKRKGLLSEDAPWEEKRSKVEALPFEFFTHCHHECPMLALAIRGTKVTAWRGSPQKIEPDMMATPEMGWTLSETTLREVCDVLGMAPPETGLGWWLVSNWS